MTTVAIHGSRGAAGSGEQGRLVLPTITGPVVRRVGAAAVGGHAPRALHNEWRGDSEGVRERVVVWDPRHRPPGYTVVIGEGGSARSFTFRRHRPDEEAITGRLWEVFAQDRQPLDMPRPTDLTVVTGPHHEFANRGGSVLYAGDGLTFTAVVKQAKPAGPSAAPGTLHTIDNPCILGEYMPPAIRPPIPVAE